MKEIELFDTHCHIQEAVDVEDGNESVQSVWQKGGFDSPEGLIKSAAEAGVRTLMCVGCTLRDSRLAVNLATKHENVWASIGIHPHEASGHMDKSLQADFAELAKASPVRAIGECGLDYYYNHSPKADQITLLEFQLDLARNRNLPVILHVRDAFDDFWPIFDNFPGLTGVVHSFTAYTKQMEESVGRGLMIGLNGIMTFTKDEKQLEAAKRIPLEMLVLETDAPFLTPVPFRGKICQPKYVRLTAEFLSELRGEDLDKLAAATTHNAKRLFKL